MERDLWQHHKVVFVFVRRSDEVKPFVTKDKSTIREFFHPLHDVAGEVPRNITFSIALATVKPGKRTLKHIHETSHEFYYITQGVGVIRLNSEKLQIKENTLIYIPAKTRHTVTNTGKDDLLILCICSPPYTHEDTRIVQ